MSKHTPGPWKDRIATGTADHEISGKGAGVCVIPYRYATTEIRNANARLIAAAPDLLAALRAWAMAANGDGIDKRNLITLVKMTESAIAKATQP